MLEVRSQSIKTTIKEKEAMNPKENNQGAWKGMKRVNKWGKWGI